MDIFVSGLSVDLDGGFVLEIFLYNDIGNFIEDYSKIDNVGFGSGSSWDEVDYYKFELSEDKNLIIFLNKLSVDIDLELFDSFDILIKDFCNKKKKNEKIEEEFELGIYYVGVEFKGNVCGNYILNIKVFELGSSVDEDGGKFLENVIDIGVLILYEEEDFIGC